MTEFIWNLASFVIALGILITVHEYGHFWVARRNKVQVERFSIGFGKALWRKKDKHGTEFVIALIPLGGYVKMLDSRVDEVSESQRSVSFDQKTVYQRIAIIAAGPLANFVFAIFAFYLMFLIGVPSVKPIIGEVEADSIAAKSGLMANSEIISVAGKKTLDWQDVNLALASQIGAKSFSIVTKDNDSVSTKSYQLNTENWHFDPEQGSAISSLGLQAFRPQIHNEIAHIVKQSPAEQAGFQIGDQLIAINGQTVAQDWFTFSEQIKLYGDKQVAVEVIRNQESVIIEVTPKLVARNGQSVGYLGIAPKSEPYPEAYKIELSYGLIDSLTESMKRTWSLIVLSLDMIGKLITGDVSVKNLSGPISIAQGAGDHAGYGFVYFLGFLALISINLGIINLLPVPVLDGGHLFYYLVEAVTGKPVPEKIQELGFKFGTLALLSLMAIALFNDFSRL